MTTVALSCTAGSCVYGCEDGYTSCDTNPDCEEYKVRDDNNVLITITILVYKWLKKIIKK